MRISRENVVEHQGVVESASAKAVTVLVRVAGLETTSGADDQVTDDLRPAIEDASQEARRGPPTA